MSDVFNPPKGILMKSLVERRRALTAAVAASALASGPALAESQYGYATAPTTTVTASARVNLVVNVAKLILLRVGSTTTGGDTLSWTSSYDIPSSPVTGNNQDYAWTGAGPAAGLGVTAPPPLLASAWTNSSGGGSLSYVATPFAAGGPALSDISVASGASTGYGLTHPLPAALATASTTASAFPPNAIANANWTYTLGGTPAGWTAGTYSSTITYTATSV